MARQGVASMFAMALLLGVFASVQIQSDLSLSHSLLIPPCVCVCWGDKGV
jgi:hypothetical protein